MPIVESTLSDNIYLTSNQYTKLRGPKCAKPVDRLAATLNPATVDTFSGLD